MDQIIGELVFAAIIYVCKFVYGAATRVAGWLMQVFRAIFDTAPKGRRSKKKQRKGSEEPQQQAEKPQQDSNEDERSKQEESSNEQNEQNTQEPNRPTDRVSDPSEVSKSAKRVLNKTRSSTFASKSSMALMSWLVVSIPQGSIGLTKTLGVLQPQIMQPGIHLAVPGIHEVLSIKTTVETHTIADIPCGTSTGVLLNFEKVEVVSRLKTELAYQTVKNYSTNYNELFIRDKVHYLVNKFCSKYSVREVAVDKFEGMDEWVIAELKEDNRPWAPGIQIISLRITKPLIPESIRANYELIEKIKVELMIQAERQRVLVERQATQHKQRMIQAQSALEVTLIELNKTIEMKKNELQMQLIEAEIYLARSNTESDNEFLIEEKNVEADNMRLNGAFLQAYGRECLKKNVTFMLGDYLPKIVV